jgi:hypothetical protein
MAELPKDEPLVTWAFLFDQIGERRNGEKIFKEER